jgi:protein SCO1/2
MVRHWFSSFCFIIGLTFLMGGLTSVQAQYRKLEEPPPMQGSPEILKKIGIDQKLNAQIPMTLPFKDETGRDISLQEYFGSKPVILAPVYYECPMLCTLTINGVVQSLDQLQTLAGKDFTVVAVSFNPWKPQNWQ